MDIILKASTDWVKAELISTPFFAVFGLGFIIAGVCFWQAGTTEMANAFVIPMMVAGTLLMVIGVGLYVTNRSRMKQFKQSYSQNAQGFVDAEIERAVATLKEYKNVVFTAIPIIIAVCALVIYMVNTPLWRASMMTTIAMLVVILIVDGLAHARIDRYYQQLLEFNKKQSN